MQDDKKFVRLTKELIQKHIGNKLTIYTEDKSKTKEIWISKMGEDFYCLPLGINDPNVWIPYPKENSNIFIYD